MNSQSIVTIISVLVLGTGATASAEPNNEELKQRVLAQAQSVTPEDYAFTRTSHIEVTANGRSEKKVTIEKFDPTKPAEARWTLLSVDGDRPTAAELKKHRKEVAKRRIVPGYHHVAAYFGAPATASSESGKTVFRFASLPRGAVALIDIDVSRNCSAEALVAEAEGAPFVEKVQLTVKPMRLLLLLKLNRFEITARYGIDSQGKPFLMESTATISGSGFGQEGTMHNTTTYSDYRSVRDQTRS